MAANVSWATLGKATELRQRLLFTIGLLIVYRVGTYIPVPGIDGQALRDFMEQAAGGIAGVLGMFTGGALSRMGIFALGIMPYISASIIVQLLSSMWAPLQQLKKEGEQRPAQDHAIHALRHGLSGHSAGLWPGGFDAGRRACDRARVGSFSRRRSSRWLAVRCS